MSAACRECGQPIRWTRTARGGWMPLDPEPDERGQMVLRGDVALSVARAGESRRAGELLWQAHHFTCPARRDHGARGRMDGADRAHAQLDAETVKAAERDTERRARQTVNALRAEAARLRNCADALDRLADGVDAL